MTRTRKASAHRARSQRHRDARRDKRKAYRPRTVKAELRSRNVMSAKRQPPRGLPKLVRMARERMMGRHKLLMMPREGQKRDAA